MASGIPSKADLEKAGPIIVRAARSYCVLCQTQFDSPEERAEHDAEIHPLPWKK